MKSRSQLVFVAEEPGHFPLLDEMADADDGHFVMNPFTHVHFVGDGAVWWPQLDVDLMRQGSGSRRVVCGSRAGWPRHTAGQGQCRARAMALLLRPPESSDG